MRCMRFDVVLARVHQHGHLFTTAEAGVSEVQCDTALSTTGSACEQMSATLSHTREPIVEQRNSAAYDAANGCVSRGDWHDG